MNSSEPQGFSIVLCTHNGRSRLQPTLEHLAALRIPAAHTAELLVVDNASTDDTAAFVAHTWEQLRVPFPLRLLSEPRAGKGYATEAGYDATRYAYILTVDDDNWLAPDYLEQATGLLQIHPDVGILQAHSTGAFETPPPTWVKEFEGYFIIGSPIERPGYFPKHSFFVWGAGMVIRQADWVRLRQYGFSALTSKMSGKAAGEDNELAIGMLLLGRRIYYSDQLRYQHFMPAVRVTWDKLRQNFETLGYVSHYLFVYGLAFEAYYNQHQLSDAWVNKHFAAYFNGKFSKHTWKQRLYYLLRPRQELYQLWILRDKSHRRWFRRLRASVLQDVAQVQKWAVPLLEQVKPDFEWIVKNNVL